MAPSYQTNDPKGWMGDPRRGAAMGRDTLTGAHDGSRLTLRRIRLDAGGYDPLGAYFGIGRPLYWCASKDGQIDFMLRAESRRSAKRQVSERYPTARFCR